MDTGETSRFLSFFIIIIVMKKMIGWAENKRHEKDFNETFVN